MRYQFDTSTAPQSLKDFVGDGVTVSYFFSHIPVKVLMETWLYCRSLLYLIPHPGGLKAVHYLYDILHGDAVSVLDRKQMSLCLSRFMSISGGQGEYIKALEKLSGFKHPENAYMVFVDRYRRMRVMTTGYSNNYVIGLIEILTEGVDTYECYSNAVGIKPVHNEWLRYFTSAVIKKDDNNCFYLSAHP